MGIEKLLEGIELPKWARWAAQDEDGGVWIFSLKPQQAKDIWGGFWGCAPSERPIKVLRFKVTGDWRDTLTRLEAR